MNPETTRALVFLALICLPILLFVGMAAFAQRCLGKDQHRW